MAATAKTDYRAILDEALAAARAASPERASGCGRVYVCIMDRKHANGVKRALKATPMRPLRYIGNAYGAGGNALYVGYDNATGRELAHGTAVAAVLKAHGIDCYRDEVGD